MKTYRVIGGDAIGSGLYTNQILVDTEGEFALHLEEVMQRVEGYPKVMGELIQLRNQLSRIREILK